MRSIVIAAALVSTLAACKHGTSNSAVQSSDDLAKVPDNVTCTVRHAGGSSGETSATVTLDLAKGTSLDQDVDGAKLKLSIDPRSGVASVEIFSSRAELGGNVKGLLAPAHALDVRTINDFGFGDGSDVEVSCVRSGARIAVAPVMPTLATCTADDENGDLVTATADISSGSGSIDGSVDTEISVMADGRLQIWPTSDEHGGFVAIANATEAAPMSAKKNYRTVSCWAK